MINMKPVFANVCDFADFVTENEIAAYELTDAIMSQLYELEREDDRNGTDELEYLLENKSIEWIAKEYGLVP